MVGRNRFVQACIRVTHDRLPLTVYFRRDKGASRAEVVFELGRLWSKTPPANMDAYRVTILQGDKIVFATDVPQHFWSSRWRWQSAPRPVTVRVSDLIANGLLPHYDNNVNRGSAHPLRQQSYEIMGLAGIIRSMGSTGERPDIGPVTEAQGEFICTGNKGALETLLAQGESAGTWPWHYRDENTGAPSTSFATRTHRPIHRIPATRIWQEPIAGCIPTPHTNRRLPTCPFC